MYYVGKIKNNKPEGIGIILRFKPNGFAVNKLEEYILSIQVSLKM